MDIAQPSFLIDLKKRLPAPVVLVALGFAIAGLFPHLAFSYREKQLAFFKGAYDEDYYLLHSLDDSSLPYRYLSDAVVRIFYFLSGKNIDVAVILCDTISPFVCCLLAGYWASYITQDRLCQALLTFGIIVCADVLSFANSAVWPEMFNLNSYRGNFPTWLRQTVPDSRIAYLTIYRTPEPQISWVILFANLSAFSSAWTLDPNTQGRQIIYKLGLFYLVYPFIYLFCAIPLLILQFCYAFLSFKREGAKIFWCLLSLSILGAILYVTILAASSGKSTNLIFNSHLPILTPAALLCLMFVVIEIAFSKGSFRDPKYLWGLTVLVLPILILNQQVVTGRMVSVKEWERYICYPLMIFGITQMRTWSCPWIKYILRFRWKTLKAILLLFCFVLLYSCQKKNYSMFIDANVNSIEFRNLCDKAKSIGANHHLRLIIPDPYMNESFFELRSYNTVNSIHGLSKAFDHPNSKISSETNDLPSWEYHLPLAFEQFARSGITPNELDRGMKEAIHNRSCWPYLIAFFSFLDCWGPASEERALNIDGLIVESDRLTEYYRSYLTTYHPIWDIPVLVISSQSLEKLPPTVYWKFLKISESTEVSQGKRFYIYLQVPRNSLNDDLSIYVVK